MSVGIPELQVLGVLNQTLFLPSSTNGFHTKRSLFGSTTLFSTQVQSRKAILKLLGKLIRSITCTKTASSGAKNQARHSVSDKPAFLGRCLLSFFALLAHMDLAFISTVYSVLLACFSSFLTHLVVLDLG